MYMGNICSRKRVMEPLIKLDDLKQITVEKTGDCFICDEKNVIGILSWSVIEEYKIFICNKCRNIKTET